VGSPVNSLPPCGTSPKERVNPQAFLRGSKNPKMASRPQLFYWEPLLMEREEGPSPQAKPPLIGIL